jgi:hypothetical protein
MDCWVEGQMQRWRSTCRREGYLCGCWAGVQGVGAMLLLSVDWNGMESERWWRYLLGMLEGVFSNENVRGVG